MKFKNIITCQSHEIPLDSSSQKAFDLGSYFIITIGQDTVHSHGSFVPQGSMLFIKTECFIKTAEIKQLARENIEEKRERHSLIYMSKLNLVDMLQLLGHWF